MPGKTLDWTDYKLTDAQKEHWLEHGFIKIENCFSREFAERWTRSIWTRMGADPNDKSTWPTEKMNMPGHTVLPVKEYAPKAYAAMCELVGGEDKVADWSVTTSSVLTEHAVKQADGVEALLCAPGIQG
jgi:hypothetical protein